MLKPIINPKLSLRARSLFYYFIEKGRIMSADELWASKEFPEGRDAILNALNELKDLNYIKAIRTNVNGKWQHNLKFTESATKMLAESREKSAPWISGHMYSSTTTSDISTSTNIDNNPNGLLSIGAQPQKEEVVVWKEEEEDVVGAVGKIDDRQARLNAKYKKPVKAQRNSRDRINTPEELWSTNDLVAEFYDLSHKIAPDMSSQVNSKYLATWINKHVGEGTDRYTILKAMRMFFEDPRNLHDVGNGRALWQRFFAYYPTIQATVKKTSSTVYEDEEFLSHQEKMLKLLGGE